MIEGNISMEEDTELRDLVVQTLESNGVLAKVRAELRASVFLALEEQESVMNPEPLLNKTVKQYLANSEGKLLFSLVREFLEYFGLDYTISVYDPETYFGKEYNYVGRNKLSEELGINSTEPLLGEILKNVINGVFNGSQKNENHTNANKTNDTPTKFSNATFDKDPTKTPFTEDFRDSVDNDSLDKVSSDSESSPKVPINVTITDKKVDEASKLSKNLSNGELDNSVQSETMNNQLAAAINLENKVESNNNFGYETNVLRARNRIDDNRQSSDDSNSNLPNDSDSLTHSGNYPIDNNKDEAAALEKRYRNDHVSNNVQNKKHADGNFLKTVFFEEIIVDGKKEKVNNTYQKTESLLGELPPLMSKNNSAFSELPSINGRKANLSEIKKIMDIGIGGIDNYDDDFASSASGSANEQSPLKEADKIYSSSVKEVGNRKNDKSPTAMSDNASEEIEEIDEIIGNTSCTESTMSGKKEILNFGRGEATKECIEEV